MSMCKHQFPVLELTPIGIGVGVGHEMSVVRCQVLGIGRRALGVRRWASGIGY